MCASCDRPHPSKDECFKLFYLHDGVLYRSALPRSMFKRESNYTIYHHPDRVNKPAKVFQHNSNTEVLGYGQRPVGAILAIMDGKEVSEWYHRNDKPKHSCKHGHDNDDDDDFRRYAKIPPRHKFKQVFFDFLRG